MGICNKSLPGRGGSKFEDLGDRELGKVIWLAGVFHGGRKAVE